MIYQYLCQFVCTCLNHIYDLSGGYYHGKLVFPKEFPFKPPKIIMITPNGRFKTDTRYANISYSFIRCKMDMDIQTVDIVNEHSK